jgi:hypothetical protein
VVPPDVPCDVPEVPPTPVLDEAAAVAVTPLLVLVSWPEVPSVPLEVAEVVLVAVVVVPDVPVAVLVPVPVELAPWVLPVVLPATEPMLEVPLPDDVVPVVAESLVVPPALSPVVDACDADGGTIS